jgi:aspartyl aminopeptidase
MNKMQNFAEKLLDFCYKSPTSYQAVSQAREMLNKKGFTEIFEQDSWKLKAGKGYYFVRNDSALVAFIVGSKKAASSGFRIVGAHTDSPGFRIKPACEIKSEGKYLKLNTEVYGGPILNTWMDRPLGIAGRVAIKTRNSFKPEIKMLNINKPVCVIPNISVHMNPELNKGYVLNKQTDTLPFLGIVSEKLSADGYLIKLLADELEEKTANIIDFDLYLYDFAKGCLTGANNELISTGRIDDLEAVHAGITALTEVRKPQATCVMICFDNEEVGSMTRQGADSQILSGTLERICISGDGNREDYYRALANSFIVSADGAHAVHPNLGIKCDPTSRPTINGGIVIKISANKSYTSDAVSSAIFSEICRKAKLPVQKFVNRSDMRGGSTIGPINSTQAGINSIDIGVPMLAMHSIRELCGVSDHFDMYKALKEFFRI